MCGSGSGTVGKVEKNENEKKTTTVGEGSALRPSSVWLTALGKTRRAKPNKGANGK